jgi:branched-subunit amino acid ABC-type transport system permease component
VLWPFIVTGVAVGALYAVSAVGMVVLYRATGVLNLAYGALGALTALISWELLQQGVAEWPAYAIGVGVAALVSLVYGALLGPYLADREPVVKATATLGLALAILGLLQWYWTDDVRTLSLPTDDGGFDLGSVYVTNTQVVALALGVAVTALTTVFLAHTGAGRSMRALADDRELAAMLGARVRAVEALAWFASGTLAGVSGLLLADLTTLTAAFLTFLVIPALAACVVGRFTSLWATLAGGLLVGVLEAVGTPYEAISRYRSAVPFIVAIAVVLFLQRHRTVTIRVAR